MHIDHLPVWRLLVQGLNQKTKNVLSRVFSLKQKIEQLNNKCTVNINKENMYKIWKITTPTVIQQCQSNWTASRFFRRYIGVASNYNNILLLKLSNMSNKITAQNCCSVIVCLHIYCSDIMCSYAYISCSNIMCSYICCSNGMCSYIYCSNIVGSYISC